MNAHRPHVLLRGHGPALLLSHGAGGGIEGNFGEVLDDLAADHLVIGPRLPGADGRPPSPVPLDLDRAADELIEAAEGCGPVTILGESLGSAVAVRAAVRHPEMVAGLVLTAGFAIADPVLDLTARLVTTLHAAGEHALIGYLTQVGCLVDSQLATAAPAELRAAGDTVVLTAGIADHFDLVQRVDVRHDLSEIRARTLVVVPLGDRLVLPASGRELAARIPGAELVELADAPHILVGPQRAAWLRHVRRFLADVELAA